MLKKGLVCVLAASGLFWARATAANISGTVADQSGAPLSRVEIVLTCIDNGKVWSVHTDKGGRFRAPDLPRGDYVLGAFSSGFVTATQGVQLEDGAEEFLKFTLQSEVPASQGVSATQTAAPPAPAPKKEKSIPSQAKVSPPASVEPPPAQPVVRANPKTVGFAVQIAAYQTRKKAETLRGRLKSGGYPAYIVEANVAGLGRHYRVRVGPFQSAKRTKEVASEVRLRFPQEGPHFWIIPTTP